MYIYPNIRLTSNYLCILLRTDKNNYTQKKQVCCKANIVENRVVCLFCIQLTLNIPIARIYFANFELSVRRINTVFFCVNINVYSNVSIWQLHSSVKSRQSQYILKLISIHTYSREVRTPNWVWKYYLIANWQTPPYTHPRLINRVWSIYVCVCSVNVIGTSFGAG